MKEIDFDPATMTRASAADVFRMWKLLWGDKIISRGGLELAPAWSHKPNDVSSNLTLASSIEVSNAMEVEDQRNQADSQERPANSTGIICDTTAVSYERNTEPTTLATECPTITTQGE